MLVCELKKMLETCGDNDRVVFFYDHEDIAMDDIEIIPEKKEEPEQLDLF